LRIETRCSAAALFPPNLLGKTAAGIIGGLDLRINNSFVLAALSLAGSLSIAAAQDRPQPPMVEYNPAPPAVYPSDEPPGYSRAPLPPLETGTEVSEPPGSHYGRPPPTYRDANGVPAGSYDPRYNEQTREMGPSPYPPGDPQYVVPAGRPGPQPLPAAGADAVPRPPVDVGGAAPQEITGAMRPAHGATSAADRATTIAALPPEDQPEQGPAKQLPPQFQRQLVDYPTTEPAGTIIIDTPHTFLYLVRGHGKAMRYGIGVGREGFTWSGTERIRRMSEWPDWHPPKEMIERQPYLPRFMAGGESNPLGARALYLGNTIYRIHGTNQPSTIGSFVSSGCIRLTNGDIEDLYGRVNVGTRVVVLPGPAPASASAQAPIAR
jgi:lipoprotein-anchoring transpeptidase ErfK/SrfK